MSLDPKRREETRKLTYKKKDARAIIKEARGMLQLYIDEEMLMSEPNLNIINEMKDGQDALRKGDYETAASALDSAVELWQSDYEYDEVAPLVALLRDLVPPKKRKKSKRKK